MRYVAVRIARVKYGQSADGVLPILAACSGSLVGGSKRNESPLCDVYTITKLCHNTPFYLLLYGAELARRQLEVSGP